MDMVELLERSFAATGRIVKGVSEGQLADATPCSKWTLRQLLNHTLGSIGALTRVASGEKVDPSVFDPDAMAEVDRIGRHPHRTFEEVFGKALAAWRRPGVFERAYAMPMGEMPAQVVASIQLLESTVHGWDVAQASGQSTTIDPEVAAVLLVFAQQTVSDHTRGSRFGPAVKVRRSTPDADKLLAHLGRQP